MYMLGSIFILKKSIYFVPALILKHVFLNKLIFETIPVKSSYIYMSACNTYQFCWRILIPMLSMSFHPRWLSIHNTKQQKLNKNCADQSQLSKPRHVYTWVNSGCRCPKIGNALALRTRGGQFEGPGPIISLCGKSMGFIRAWGGGLMLGISVDKHCTRTNSVTRFDTQLRTTDSIGTTTRTARSPHICVLPQSKCT